MCISTYYRVFVGNDICSQIKELQQANQLGSRLIQYKQTATGAQRARPYRQFASENAHNRGPFLHARDQRQKKRPLRRPPTFQGGTKFKSLYDNKVHANIFSVITFQESDKVFPKMTKTAGRLHQFEHEWQKIASDNEILSYIRGCNIDFDSEPLPYAELTNHDAFSNTPE